MWPEGSGRGPGPRAPRGRRRPSLSPHAADPRRCHPAAAAAASVPAGARRRPPGRRGVGGGAAAGGGSQRQDRRRLPACPPASAGPESEDEKRRRWSSWRAGGGERRWGRGGRSLHLLRAPPQASRARRRPAGVSALPIAVAADSRRGCPRLRGRLWRAWRCRGPPGAGRAAGLSAARPPAAARGSLVPGGGAEPGCLRPAAAGPGSGCPRSARGGGGGRTEAAGAATGQAVGSPHSSRAMLSLQLEMPARTWAPPSSSGVDSRVAQPPASLPRGHRPAPRVQPAPRLSPRPVSSRPSGWSQIQ